jgi:hypothetical protein
LQHPLKRERPTGIEPKRLVQQCGWKDGDRGGDLAKDKEGARGASSPEPPPNQGACHRLWPLHLASRSPVKASLRLSAFGLDGARPRCRQIFPLPGNGRRSLQELNAAALPEIVDFALDTDRLSHGRTEPLSARQNKLLRWFADTSKWPMNFNRTRGLKLETLSTS